MESVKKCIPSSNSIKKSKTKLDLQLIKEKVSKTTKVSDVKVLTDDKESSSSETHSLMNNLPDSYTVELLRDRSKRVAKLKTGDRIIPSVNMEHSDRTSEILRRTIKNNNDRDVPAKKESANLTNIVTSKSRDMNSSLLSISQSSKKDFNSISQSSCMLKASKIKSSPIGVKHQKPNDVKHQQPNGGKHQYPNNELKSHNNHNKSKPYSNSGNSSNKNILCNTSGDIPQNISRGIKPGRLNKSDGNETTASSGNRPKSKGLKKSTLPKSSQPALSFQDLMALANKNKDAIKDSIKVDTIKDMCKDESRPMTQEEKDRCQRVNTKEYQDWLKYGSGGCSNMPGQGRENDLVHKDISSLKRGSNTNLDCQKRKLRREEKMQTKLGHIGPFENLSHTHKSSQSDHLNQATNFIPVSKNQPSLPTGTKNITSSVATDSCKRATGDAKRSGEKRVHVQESSSKSQTPNVITSSKTSSSSNHTSFGRSDTRRGEGTRRPRTAASDNVNPWDRIYNSIKSKDIGKSKALNKKRYDKDRRACSDESDENYDDDSEDSFICDEDEGEDYSSHIREIFGYDKNKYKHENDEDIRGMESSFCQQMKEEIHSGREGRKEDLEDMQKELEEIRRKKLKKQMLKNRR